MDSPPTFDPDGAEQREQIRVALDESALALQRERLAAEASGVGQVPTMAERVRALGFEDEAEKIFDLMPLVHVAWADGKIQDGERAMILDVLKIRSLASGKAFATLEALLEKRPSDAYLDESLAVLKELVAGEAVKSKTIVGLCIAVAEAAGGFLGLRPISRAERDVIERIAKALGDEATAEFERRFR